MLQKKLFVSLLFLSATFVVTTNAARRSYDCEGKIAKALERFERERYNDVKTILADVKYNCSGHPAMDTALYYLGMAYLGSGAYMDARIEFERLIQDFPFSKFQEEAYFRLGYATFLESNPPQKDQTKTKEAIREFAEFIEEFPQSPYADTAAYYMSKAQGKLAEKMLMNAKFYEKIERYESAVVYYQYLLEEYPGSAFASEAQIRLAEALVKGNRYADADVVLTHILDSDLSEDVKRSARRLQKRIRREPPESESTEGAVAEETVDPGTEITPIRETIEKMESSPEVSEQGSGSTDTPQGTNSTMPDSVEMDTAVSADQVDLPVDTPLVVDTDPQDSLMEKDRLEKMESDIKTPDAEVETKSNTSVVVEPDKASPDTSTEDTTETVSEKDENDEEPSESDSTEIDSSETDSEMRENSSDTLKPSDFTD